MYAAVVPVHTRSTAVVNVMSVHRPADNGCGKLSVYAVWMLLQLNDAGFSRTADGELKYDLPAADLNSEHIGIYCLLFQCMNAVVGGSLRQQEKHPDCRKMCSKPLKG